MTLRGSDSSAAPKASTPQGFSDPSSAGGPTPPPQPGPPAAGGSESPGFLSAALAYAARGWHVFPLRPGGKEPLTQNGHLDATVDPNVIRQWWERHPNAGIGIAAAPSGLVVLDVDVGPGKGGRESLAALEADGGLPRTLTARTGGGGWHAVYRRPEGVPAARRIRFRPGLDLIGDGYFIAAPSVHPSGTPYRWLNDVDPLPLPKRLHSFINERSEIKTEAYNGGTPASPEILEAALREVIELGPSVKGQGGDQHAYQVGAILLGGYDLQWQDAWAIAKRWNDHFEENQWTDAKLALKLRNGARYAQGTRGERRTTYLLDAALKKLGGDNPFKKPSNDPEEEDDFDSLCRKTYDDIIKWRESGGAEGSDSDRPYFEAATILIDSEPERLDWLVRGLVPNNAMGVIAGEPKSNKTWSALELSVAIASNTPAFGEFQTGPVRPAALFLAEDNKRAVRNRLRSICADRGVDYRSTLERIFISCRRSLDLANDVHLTQIIASSRLVKPVFVVLDPLRDLHTGNEDKSDDMAPVMQRLRCIRDLTGASVSFIHHAKKPSNDSRKQRGGSLMRGSGAIFAGIDFGLFLKDVETDGRTIWETTAETTIRDAQGAGDFKLTLEVEDDDNGEAVRAKWNVSRDFSSDGPTKKPGRRGESLEEAEGRIIEALTMLGGQALIDPLIRHTGMSNVKGRKTIDSLVRKNVVIRKREGGVALEEGVYRSRLAEAEAAKARAEKTAEDRS